VSANDFIMLVHKRHFDRGILEALYRGDQLTSSGI